MWLTVDPITGSLRTTDYWEKLPQHWACFHHELRRRLYVPREPLHGPTLQELGPDRMTLVFELDDHGMPLRDSWINDSWSLADSTSAREQA